LWLCEEPPDLPLEARELLRDGSNEMVFSVASVWEIAIKFALGRPDFRVDTRVLRRGLLDNGYAELAVTADHALATLALPPIHKDPFDLRLVAQATVEGRRVADGRSDRRALPRSGPAGLSFRGPAGSSVTP